MHLSVLKWCIAYHLGALLAGLTASAQTFGPQPEAMSKIPIRAELVLSPEFCATKKRQSLALKDVLRVGEAACSQLESGLNAVFSSLTRVEKVPAPGASAAEVVLIPKFIDINSTQPLLGSSPRELVILVEWTIQDADGRTIWLQTVQGSSRHKLGWIITTKAQRQLAEAAVDDLAKASATRMSIAPELRKLAP